jgi:hypothetical protein
MTSIVKVTVMIVFAFAAAELCALAAEPSVIKLSCDGKLTNTRVGNAKPQPINKMNMVVNLADKTVSFSGHSAGIDKADVRTFPSAARTTPSMVKSIVYRAPASATATLAYKLLCKPAS